METQMQQKGKNFHTFPSFFPFSPAVYAITSIAMMAKSYQLQPINYEKVAVQQKFLD